MISTPIKGRGTAENPKNRFEIIEIQPDEDLDPADQPLLQTRFFVDTSKTILSTNDSPDVGFEVSVNPYRGCEHGCTYCFARPTHEYLGLSSGIDFESMIMVKKNAPALLREELISPRWEPKVVTMSGVTDCYQPVERHLKITRGCLEVLAEFKNPVAIITKNYLVTRDRDILGKLARLNAAKVYISVTSLDPNLARVLEPRASQPRQRLQAIEELTQAGIPVGVMVAPILPAINDHEIPAILAAARKAGAVSAGHVILRLPYAVKDLFEGWLERYFPDRKEKVLNRIRAIRGGKLNQSEFGKRMRGEGIFAEQIHNLFSVSLKKEKFPKTSSPLTTKHFINPNTRQLNLFSL